MLAYEPVWAIGTGKVASPEQAQEVGFLQPPSHDYNAYTYMRYFCTGGINLLFESMTYHFEITGTLWT